jgi:superfamily II DNA or RNA helicase
VNLAEFQEDAVKKARKILARYDGVMIADSVGLGKTWIGKKLLEDFAYHMRQKALVICPASLREMWENELTEANIAAAILSQEELGREEFDPSPWTDADLVLIDESHNFRNQTAQRYAALEQILGANGGRGRDGTRKKVILLTATPISNDLFDLYNQFSLITQGDRSYLASCGIGDLYKYFLSARRESRARDGAFALFNLLEEMVIRRSRPFIRQAYPNATIRKKEADGTWSEMAVRFPERRLKTIHYNLEATYVGIYDEVVNGVDSLRLAPYNLENYKKEGVQVDEFEAGREQALVGIFKSRYLKRFESSVDAFRISIHRALSFLKTFESYILDGKLLKSTDFHKVLRYLSRENEEDDAIPSSVADEIDANEEARGVLESMAPIDPALYDLRKLHQAVQHDVDVLTDIWQRVKEIKPENDAKLIRLKELLSKDLKGQKVLIFSYYKDTARYLYRHLGHPENPAAMAFCKKLGELNIRRMDSGADARERIRIVQGFAPKANHKPEWVGTDREINILISTDVLSEGQNLQDCGYLVNYDLHWNPTRMVQRAGRIDRIGTDFENLWIYNMFPDRGLERLLGIVQSLNLKIADIDQAGFLDASVLGETVHPRNFNTLRRISDEDGSVIEEEEQFTELASNEFLMQQLRALMDGGGKEMLDSLPDGIHSGLVKSSAKGVFFYFQAAVKEGEKLHFWKYYDVKAQTIIDNRYIIANLIACQNDTPRVVDPDLFNSVFDLQEKTIADILESEEEKRALEAAPRSVDPIQQTVATALQSYLNHPDVNRREAIEVIRFLNQPMLRIQIQKLRQAYREFQSKNDIKTLLSAIEELRKTSGGEKVMREPAEKSKQLTREDLRLICFDVVSAR